jgi:hypothetical protein
VIIARHHEGLLMVAITVMKIQLENFIIWDVEKMGSKPE